MTGSEETITVNVNVEVAPGSLQSIVGNVKHLSGELPVTRKHTLIKGDLI